MKDNLEIYKIWAPEEVEWSQWAKPVLFMGERNRFVSMNAEKRYDVLEVTKIDWISTASSNTMIIVDLPGVESIEEGMGLAHIGYRPVPLYNGVDGLNPLVDVRQLGFSLFRAADELSQIHLRENATPVFLLDSNRMEGSKTPGKFDNRWSVFAQDMPSASYLIEKGINKVIVRTHWIKDDLSHILCRYQDKGIDIYLCDKTNISTKTTVYEPPKFKSIFYRFAVMMGLRRNSAGGFGSTIPEPSNSSGARFH